MEIFYLFGTIDFAFMFSALFYAYLSFKKDKVFSLYRKYNIARKVVYLNISTFIIEIMLLIQCVFIAIYLVPQKIKLLLIAIIIIIIILFTYIFLVENVYLLFKYKIGGKK